MPSPESDHPDEAVKFWLLRLRDEHGYIPPDGLFKAAAQVQLMQAARVPNAPSGAGISSSGWTWLGPGNIGGRIRSIVINPTTPTTMFVGSVGGGIWKTTNGGASWQPINDFMANLAVSTIIIDPTNQNTMYAGTGEGFYNGDAIQGAGVFKSVDGGNTWAQLSSTNNPNFYWVDRLAISPNGSTILAATGSGFWRSANGGTSWTEVNTSDSTAWAVKDIVFSPTDSTMAIASGSYGLAWYSSDAGLTWTRATGLPSLDWLGRVELAYAPNNPSIVYAGVAQNQGEVWKSADGGHSYALANTGTNYLSGQGWYDDAVWVDPTNANTIVVGGTDLMISTNGGTSLTDIGGYTGGVHPDQHIILAHPGFNGSTNKTVFVGNDGGIFTTSNINTANGSSGWTSLNNNLGITQFYGAAGNPTTGIIVGGTQDNYTLRFTGGTNNWTAMFGGDGGFDAADPTDPSYFYGEYVDLYIHRSTDGGVSSSYIYGGITDAGTCANFIAPFILDPNNSSTMLAGGCSLWRSTNVKATTPTWTSNKGATTGNQPISAIAVAPGNSNIIWVGYNNGEVYKTTNGTFATPTWTRMDLNSPNLPQKYVTRLTIDRNNSNIVYATYGGYTSNNVWRTTDGGNTWSLIVGSGATQLPQIPVHSLVTSPFNPSWLYVGTEIGVFDSSDGGANWTVPQDGPANVAVDELFWMNNTLVAATHGRGLFRVDTSGTIACYTLTTSITPSGSGTVATNPSPNCSNGTQYTYGTTVQLTANPNTGYAFSSWSGDINVTFNPSAVMMNATKSVTATFTQPLPDLQPYAPSGYPYPVVPSSIIGTHQVNTLHAGQTTYFDWHFINSGNASANGNFYVELWVDNTRYVRYPFSNWGVGWVGGFDDWAETIPTPGWHTVKLITDPDNTITESDETNNTWQMQFYWEPQCYALTTNASPSGSGTIGANPTPNCDGGTQYVSGTVITLTATANNGYAFSNWSGDVSRNANPTTLTISANKNITANFVRRLFLPFILR